MLKEIIAAVLLVAVIVLAIFNIGQLGKLTDDTIALVESGQTAAAFDRWRTSEPFTAIFFAHEELDNITTAFFRLQEQERNGNDPSVAAAQLVFLLRHLHDMEQLSLGTIM